jgi:hypothetical protein
MQPPFCCPGLGRLRWCRSVLRDLLLASLWLCSSVAGSSVAIRPVRSVPICSGVTLSASYLTDVARDQGPGFRFTLVNKTGHEIRLIEPVPSSSHWYARSGGRWLWRASSGAGGSLLDAGNEHGQLIAFAPQREKAHGDLLILTAHQSTEWVESQLENPVLEYKPGCKLCSYPGEREYQVVFAYAYRASEGQPANLLSCGLRSSPVPMPPKF